MLIDQSRPQLRQMQRERAWVEVDLAALAGNVRHLQRWVGDRVAMMAVVKADAYGHGAIAIAQRAIAAGARWLAVATLEEGVQLREAGITVPILVLGVIQTAEAIAALVHWKLQPTLCTVAQARLFSETLVQLGTPLPVHLNIDTGMSRLGTRWTEALPWVETVHRLPYLQLASVYSHFATADEPDPTVMQRQHQRFTATIAQLRRAGLAPSLIHMANSAGTLAGDRTYHHDLVRPGLAIYGLSPAPHLGDRLPLRPVLSVKARVTQVKTIEPGEGVSYGYRYIADRPTCVAVVGIGYADGVPRNLSNQMTVLFQGQRLPQIGSVTMDQLMLDATTAPHLRAGDVVTLLGEDGGDRITADDWATTLGTISWEILCSFKHRLPRIAIG